MIEPLHPAAPKACLKDTKLYEYLVLFDALRVSKLKKDDIFRSTYCTIKVMICLVFVVFFIFIASFG